MRSRIHPVGRLAAIVAGSLLTIGLAGPVAAQYGGGEAKPAAAGGLPPFLAAMKRHDIELKVSIRGADGQVRPAGADVKVGIQITAGGSKVKSYPGKTGPDGVAKMYGIPSNPEVQGMIGYETWADYQGVRYPHAFDGVPTTGTQIELTVHESTTEVGTIGLDMNVDMFPDEEALVVRQTLRLYNEGPKAVNAAALPGGGIELPCPDGAKHPEVHDAEHDPTIEVRGTDIFFKGALLPAGVGRPATISVVFTLPYAESTFEWVQNMPVRVRRVVVAAPQHKMPRARQVIPITLSTRGAFGSVSDLEQPDSRVFSVLDSDGAELAASEPLRFGIGGLPERGNGHLWAIVVAIVVVIGLVMFGFRRPEGAEGTVMSRTHLIAERDRLVRALARMRRAVEKGRMTQTRFEREREAITARLVSLYKALDRLDAR